MEKANFQTEFEIFAYKLKLYTLDSMILKLLASSLEINNNLNIENNNEKFNLINLIIDKINFIPKKEFNKFDALLENLRAKDNYNNIAKTEQADNNNNQDLSSKLKSMDKSKVKKIKKRRHNKSQIK